MGYTGSAIPVQLGQGGLLTDAAPDLIPQVNLLRATNVQIRNGVIEKASGSLRWNANPLSSGIVALTDYWASPGKQYTVCVTRDGRVWRFRDRYTVEEIVPDTDATLIAASGTPPVTLTVSGRVQIVRGGQEYVGAGGLTQPVKLFIFTGSSPVQVINGEDTVRHNLRVPATDWDGSTGKAAYPTFGMVYLNRLFVLGNSNLPHFVYASSDTVGGSPTFMYGHEDFSETTFNSALFNVGPGDNERCQMMFQYKTKLWLLKYPRGLFSLEVPDIGVASGWYFQKVNDDVGTPSITGTAPIQDDVWIMNSVGTVQSLSATLNLGGVESANMLKAMKIQNYFQQLTSPLGFGDRQALWHEQKNTAYFLYRGVSSQFNNLMLAVDFTDQNAKPTVITKDQPNVLALRRDISQREELIYGSEDGYIYLMDRPDRTVGDPSDQTAYTGEFQTPHLNLSNSNNWQMNLVAMMDKLFDFVEIEYFPTGDVSLFCDVYVDGRKTETKVFNLGRGNQLNKFTLGLSRVWGKSTRKQRLQVHGRGRTISLRFYNGDLNRNFKLTAVTIYARAAGVDEKGALDAGIKDNR